MSTNRLLIVVPHQLYRRALCLPCKLWGGFDVVGEAEDEPAAVSLAERFRPELVLIDIDSTEFDGLRLIRSIKAVDPSVSIVVLAAVHEDPRVDRALNSGAQACLLKDIDELEFVRAMMTVLNSQTLPEPPRVPISTCCDYPYGIKDELTEREMDTLRLVAQGQSNKEISEQLVISERTVANRLRQIFQKLHVSNRTQAALVALCSGWAGFSPENSHSFTVGLGQAVSPNTRQA